MFTFFYCVVIKPYFLVIILGYFWNRSDILSMSPKRTEIFELRGYNIRRISVTFFLYFLTFYSVCTCTHCVIWCYTPSYVVHFQAKPFELIWKTFLILSNCYFLPQCSAVLGRWLLVGKTNENLWFSSFSRTISKKKSVKEAEKNGRRIGKRRR